MKKQEYMVTPGRMLTRLPKFHTLKLGFKGKRLRKKGFRERKKGLHWL